MLNFFIYEAKVSLLLAVFYICYRVLLSHETFHRLNRIVLTGSVIVSFLLPFCVLTVHRTVMVPAGTAVYDMPSETTIPPVLPQDPQNLPAFAAETAANAPQGGGWLLTLLAFIYFAGVAFCLVRIIVELIQVTRIIRSGEILPQPDGLSLVIVDRDLAPFSWMRWTVLSREDYESGNRHIREHERAHICLGHARDLLVMNVLSAMQWFNPVMRMLKEDLRAIYEYEADDAVLRGGANIREYQYSLIRKAVSASGYSITNSFNHSILKNRITMMSKAKSSLARGLRALYLLPLICLGIGLQARTVYVPTDKDSNNSQNPLIILRQAWGEEKEITKAEYDALSQSRINSIQMLRDDAAFQKYGDKAAHGVIVVNLKAPMEMEEIVVVSYRDKEEELIPFRLLPDPDHMPGFQGGDLNEFSKWLCRQIDVPKDCNHSGTMKVSFEVLADGTVGDVEVSESVCPELDAIVKATILKSPKWEPGTTRDGKAIATNLRIPIVFQVRPNSK